MPLFVADHPLIHHKMTLMRSKSTNAQDFRRLIREVTYHLGYEATKDLKTSKREVETPLKRKFNGSAIASEVAIIPILRAGLGMGDTMLDLVPMAATHHIGMYRAKGSLMPVQYYNRLPRDKPCDVAYVMDPCIATSNTIRAVVSILKRWGAKKVVVIAAIGSKKGVDDLMAKHPDVDLHIGALDNKLSEDGMILPGLGDAGDRMFSTPEDEIVDVLPDMAPPTPEHPSKKRK